jgi:RNA polymerase sigma-70 factor, ECF subfamily
VSSVSDKVEQFLAAARDGSSEALGQILQAYRPYLLKIASRQMDDALQAKNGASDLVQETFLEAARDFPRFQGQSDVQLRAWLRCLLMHRFSKQGRHFRKTRKRRIDRERRLEDFLSGGEAMSAFADCQTPSQNVSAEEQLDRLRQALQQLPEDYRRVLQLRYQEGLTFEAIGPRMGRTANAVRLLWLRAVERLKQVLRVDEDG